MSRLASTLVWVVLASSLWAIISSAAGDAESCRRDAHHSANCQTCRNVAREKALSPVDWSKVDWNEVRVITSRKPPKADQLVPQAQAPAATRLALKPQA